MRLGAWAGLGFQNLLCLCQPVVLAGGFICLSCCPQLSHTAGRSWDNTGPKGCDDGYADTPESVVDRSSCPSSQSDAHLETCTRRHVHDCSLGHLGA